MPNGLDWSEERDRAYERRLREWQAYYMARGVAFGRDHELARRKALMRRDAPIRP